MAEPTPVCSRDHPVDSRPDTTRTLLVPMAPRGMVRAAGGASVPSTWFRRSSRTEDTPMAKRSRPTDLPDDTPPKEGAKAHKRRARLERELARLERIQARRLERLEKVRARAAEIRRQLAALGADAAAGSAPGPASPAAGLSGYCMREKRRVRIDGGSPVTLSNGRAAIAGVCSTCGARVVVLSKRAPSAAE